MHLLALLISACVCGTYCDEACDREASSRTSYKIGDKMKVTVNIHGASKSIHFYPTVDKLSVLEVQDTGCMFTGDADNNISISIGGSNTTEVPIRSGSNVVMFYSAIAYVTDGALQSVKWDETFDTSSCNGNVIASFCGKKFDESSCSSFRIFLGFVGTDSKKKPFDSASLMPSTFLRFGAGDLVNDVQEIFGKFKKWFKK